MGICSEELEEGDNHENLWMYASWENLRGCVRTLITSVYMCECMCIPVSSILSLIPCFHNQALLKSPLKVRELKWAALYLHSRTGGL